MIIPKLLTALNPAPASPRIGFDPLKEFVHDDWVYAGSRFSFAHAVRVRKLMRNFSTGGGVFWSAKLADLPLCEAKRWKAVSSHNRSYARIAHVFEATCRATPFWCMRPKPSFPGYDWVAFQKVDAGVNWFTVDRPGSTDPYGPCDQVSGDAYFDYAARATTLAGRLSLFDNMFKESVAFYYRNKVRPKTECYRKLIVNGREYFVSIGPFGIKVLTRPEWVETDLV